MYELTKEGIKYLKHGLPEINLIKELSKKELKFDEAKKLEDFNIAIQWAKKNGWIEVRDNFLKLTEKGKRALKEKYRIAELLKKAEEIVKPSGVTYQLLKTTGNPVDEILEYSKTNDLVIMGIRGEYEQWSNSLLGATVESITRQIAKPILLSGKSFKPFQSVICGYDGSVSANKGLQLAAFLCSALNYPLQVISVFDSAEERSAVLKEAEAYIEPYNIDYRLRHESGDVADILVNAQNSAPETSLMVIGSYGHSRLREAIIGSITVQVMRKADKPVLLAK